MADIDSSRNQLLNRHLKEGIQYLQQAETEYPDGQPYFYRNREKLQEILNLVTSRGGRVTEQEYNSAYDLLRKAKEDELRYHFDKDKFIFFAGMAIAGVLVYLFYKRVKNITNDRRK